MTVAEARSLAEETTKLKWEGNALILDRNLQLGEVKDMAAH